MYVHCIMKLYVYIFKKRIYILDYITLYIVCLVKYCSFNILSYYMYSLSYIVYHNNPRNAIQNPSRLHLFMKLSENTLTELVELHVSIVITTSCFVETSN